MCVCVLSYFALNAFTLYAPYVAIPHIRIISREIAAAMQISKKNKKTFHSHTNDYIITKGFTKAQRMFT